jgi:hypothetical protein
MIQIKSDNAKKCSTDAKEDAEICQICEIDPDHNSNEIGQHQKCATDTREHAKIGQLCEQDPSLVQKLDTVPFDTVYNYLKDEIGSTFIFCPNTNSVRLLQRTCS